MNSLLRINPRNKRHGGLGMGRPTIIFLVFFVVVMLFSRFQPTPFKEVLTFVGRPFWSAEQFFADSFSHFFAYLSSKDSLMNIKAKMLASAAVITSMTFSFLVLNDGLELAPVNQTQLHNL